MNTKKKRIVHIVGTLKGGGAKQQLQYIIDGVNTYEHVVVCLFGCEGELEPIFRENGIDLVECKVYWPVKTLIPSYRINKWIRKKLHFLFSYRLASLLSTLNADLIHSHVSTQIHLQSKAVLRSCKLPWVWTLRHSYISEGLNTRGFPAALRQIEKSENTQVTAVSNAALNEIMSFGLVSREKCKVIYNGVNLSKFFISESLRVNWRNSLSISEDSFVFGFAGRFDPVKRQDLAIKAFVSIAYANPHTFLVFAGDGPRLNELKELVSALNLSRQVIFLGFVQDMNEFYNGLDTLLLVSDSEGLPNVILEALAVGLPCIATDVGGVREIINRSEYLIPSDSPDELQRAMEEVLRENQQAMNDQDILDIFSLQNMIILYDNLYQKLLN